MKCASLQLPSYALSPVQRYNLPLLDFLDWIRRVLWRKRSPSKTSLPYTRIETWGGLEGYLHLVERQVREGEPRAIATFLFRRKRFNGYRKTAGPTDIYIDLKRSKIQGHSHTLIVVEAENLRSDRFAALPLHYGEYQWVKRGRPLLNARRRELITMLKTTSVNNWEERDRTALLITLGTCLDLLKRPAIDWRKAIDREEHLLMKGNDSSSKPGSLRDGKVSGYIIDKDPRSWD